MAKQTWQFFRAGGFDQVRLATGEDLINLGELDAKLWVALACPTKGVEFDARTLELLDTDHDGRIRASELLAACKWLGAVLKSPDALPAGSDSVQLSTLAESEEPRRLATAAKDLLSSLGAKDAGAITLAQISEAVKVFDARPFNGDGVVPVDSATGDTAGVAKELVDCLGPHTDRSGKPGFTEATLAAFFDELTAHATWRAKGEGDAMVLPLGSATEAAHSALTAVKAKVDDFFTRCRLAAFDARAIPALNRDEKDYLPIVARELSLDALELAAFPVARVEPGRALPLSTGLNPAWASAVAALVAKVVTPLLGAKSELTEAQWLDLRARFSGFEAWQAVKAGVKVERLGPARVAALLAGDARARLAALVAQEKAQEPLAQSLIGLERLVRYHRDLFKFANNFVAFRDFYQRRGPAMFQAGTLFLDQRECQLCIRVDDAARHAALAPLARTYLAYCELSRPATSEKMTIAAAFTAGDSDNLMVGRNGIFYDRGGRDWDATITKIIDAPISVRQAFWSPYKKVIRFVEEQVARRAANAEAASHERLTGTAKHFEKSADDGKVVDPPKKVDIGTVAALGVAVGGITAAFGALIAAFFGLGWWMPLGFVGLGLAISGPSMLIAWLKLRQRNLGPLLDANGWALNSAAKLNVPIGGALTRLATLPKGSSRDLSDPFADKPLPWRIWATLALVVVLSGAWYLGKLDGLLPLSARSVEVLGDKAPAFQQPAAPASPAKDSKK